MKHKIIFFLVATVVLTLNFSSHFLSTLPMNQYFDEEFPSEQFVISRSIYNLENNIDDFGGVLFFYEGMEERIFESRDKEDFYDLKKHLAQPDVKKRMYLSHSGIQDNIVYPVWRALDKIKEMVLEKGRKGSRWVERLEKYDLYYFKMIAQLSVAFLNALVISSILLWVSRAYSIGHSWVTLGLLIIFVPILGFYGRSMWWMMWSWFLPFTISALSLSFISAKETPPKYVVTFIIGALVAVAVSLKTMMGYEFLSTILVAALIPFAYYAIYHEWGLKAWLTRSFLVSILCLVGVGLAMAHHVQTIKNYGAEDPIAVIQERFEKRAYGGETIEGQSGAIVKSTQEPLLNVIGNYLIDPKGYGLPQIIFMFPFLVWLWRSRKSISTQSNQEKALLTSILLGFVGAISMLVILKGHAYIHGYDIVVWSIPLNILLCVFYANLILKKYAKIF